MPSRPETIRTDRLLMRRWRDSDREPFAALNGDPETMRFFPATMTRAESDAFANVIETRMDLQGFGLWALELAEKPASSSAIPGLTRCPTGCLTRVAWRSAGG